MKELDLSISKLRREYEAGGLTPTALVERLYPLWEEAKEAFISLASLTELRERCKHLESLLPAERASLWGVPFAVKDNIDALPHATTAACPSFSYIPRESSPTVLTLLQAGGVMVGKTNMDQFAAGLVGTRTPYGTAKNAFDDRFVPGGSSSGSGVLVGADLVSFALGTDTAGSGRVPAMLNGCVGIKPTVGRVSTSGVVPACRSLDCISCFARTVEDAAHVVRLMEKAGNLQDPCWRQPPPAAPVLNGVKVNGEYTASKRIKFGVPGENFLQFEGPGGPAMAQAYRVAFAHAIANLQALGGELIDIDFSSFCEAADLLYNSAFLAERYAGIREFLEAPPPEAGRKALHLDARMERVTATIIAAGMRFNAADVYQAFACLSQLQARARLQMAQIDVLLVPTVLQHFTVAEIEAEEKNSIATPAWSKNTLSGRFTNFVNLLDMAAIAIPSAIIDHPDLSSVPCGGEVAERARLLHSTGNSTPKLPFGVTLIGPAWSDELLWSIAERMHRKSGIGCGPAGHGVSAYHQAVSLEKTPL